MTEQLADFRLVTNSGLCDFAGSAASFVTEEAAGMMKQGVAVYGVFRLTRVYESSCAFVPVTVPFELSRTTLRSQG